MSSYEQNKYGEIFTAIIDAFKPVVCVELGVLHGYSTAHIARGLKRNRAGHLHAYDLFEKYPYNHGNRDEVQGILRADGVDDVVTLEQGDAFCVHDRYNAGTVAFLHVDISNTGDTVHRIMANWDVRMVQGGLILFEGGTTERDGVEWMVKYNAAPIKPAIETDPILNSRYVYCTYLPYPGLTVCLKKR